MSLLDTFRMTRYQDAIDASFSGSVTDPSTMPIASPWSSSSNLQRMVFEDIYGSDIPVNTREAAMKIPALSRARNLLVSTICRFPLRQLHPGETVPPLEQMAQFLAGQPSWLTDAGNVSAEHRLAWTVDDLIFYGWSCWWRENDPETGYPVAAGRINQGDWAINGDNRVEVNGEPVADNKVILIPGLHEGILTFGCDAIRDARQLHANVRARLDSPIPPIDLHQVSGQEMTPTQRTELIDLWVAARRSTSGAVGYSNKDIEVRELQSAGAEQLMIEERNAAAVEMARLVGVAAGRIDATTPKASLNYETTTGRNWEFVDFDLALYNTPINARLSMDDVCPPGDRVSLDLGDFTATIPSTTGPTIKD